MIDVSKPKACKKLEPSSIPAAPVGYFELYWYLLFVHDVQKNMAQRHAFLLPFGGLLYNMLPTKPLDLAAVTRAM